MVETPPPILHVVAVGGRERLLERGLDAVVDEVERGAALHRDRRARVVREHEHRVVVGRLVTPPTRPRLVAPRPADRAEHVAPHDGRADADVTPLEELVVDALLAAVLTDHPAAVAGGEHPVVEPRSALAERVVETLPRSRPRTRRARSRSCAPVASALTSPDRPRWRVSGGRAHLHVGTDPRTSTANPRRFHRASTVPRLDYTYSMANETWRRPAGGPDAGAAECHPHRRRAPGRARRGQLGVTHLAHAAHGPGVRSHRAHLRTTAELRREGALAPRRHGLRRAPRAVHGRRARARTRSATSGG